MSRCGSLMRTVFQTSCGRSACRGRWRRGSHPTDRNRAGCCGGSDAPEAVDLGLEPRPLLLVAAAEPLLRCRGEDADLALVGVVLDVAGSLADILHGVH